MSQENVEFARRFVERFNATGGFVWEEMDPDDEVEELLDAGESVVALRAYFDKEQAFEAVGLRE